LVQTVTRFSETSSLKITTARYYTPSGRCIQEVDYWHRDGNGNGTTVPDSLRREFRTAHNRRVWESGGILPDTIVSDTAQHIFIDELYRKSMLFRYANRYATENKMLADTFEVTDKMIEDFGAFLKEKYFVYQDEGEVKLKELRTVATNARYDKTFMDAIDKLETILKADKERLIDRYRDEIRAALKTEILGRMKGDKARYESTFFADIQLQTAISILKNKKVYAKLLGIKGK
jgi:carboxyl-terminal processing protease